MTRNFPAHAYRTVHVARRLVEVGQVGRKRGGCGNQEYMYIFMPKCTFAATSSDHRVNYIYILQPSPSQTNIPLLQLLSINPPLIA